MNEVEVSVIKYLGKVRGGIMALISIKLINEDFSFDATYFYTEEIEFITVTENVEIVLGDIKHHALYETMLKLCKSRVVPHNQLIDNIDPLDVRPYIKAIDPNAKFD